MTLRLRNYRKGFFNALRIPHNGHKKYEFSTMTVIQAHWSRFVVLFTLQMFLRLLKYGGVIVPLSKKSFKNSTRIGIVKAKGK